MWKNWSFSSILDLLDLCNLYLIYTPLYTPCVLGCLFFDINKSILLLYIYIYTHKRLKDIERPMKGDCFTELVNLEYKLFYQFMQLQCNAFKAHSKACQQTPIRDSRIP